MHKSSKLIHERRVGGMGETYLALAPLLATAGLWEGGSRT
jgi:hypothetical protein